LSAITRHRALRFSKRERSRQAGRIDLDQFLVEQVQALSQPLASPEGDDEVRLALENIAADYALVLRLRFFDEMPIKRIAAFLGAPLSTVKWRIHRGKELLREQVELLRQRGEKWKEIKNSQN
jgi:RNA polymerase sigma-70 factor (ECF subfamily)